MSRPISSAKQNFSLANVRRKGNDTEAVASVNFRLAGCKIVPIIADDKLNVTRDRRYKAFIHLSNSFVLTRNRPSKYRCANAVLSKWK